MKGLLVHDDWTTLREEYVARTYWTVMVSFGSAITPVPMMRSALSSEVGGGPAGTVTVGAVPDGTGWGAVGRGDGTDGDEGTATGAVLEVAEPLLVVP